MMTSCVVYARYSSENQRSASIEDQVRVCRALTIREGWEITRVYTDHALSGASLLRPGYQALLEDVRTGYAQLILTEALDRISRDQEHVASFYKQVRFAGARLLSVAEGEISELHVGLKGTMNALFLKDLADKTRRGLRGRIEAGRSAGGRCFGYDVVGPGVEAGGRAINEAEAAIVRRVFALFASGISPIAIAKTLNAEQVRGPQGGAWRDTTIRGHAGRSTGLLRNQLYIGRLVWNRMRFIKDPVSGRRVSRPNPEVDWLIEQVADLRIVPDELWRAVQDRLAKLRLASGADATPRKAFWTRRRPSHLLSGNVFCGACGGTMTNVGRDRIGCGTAAKQGRCSNGRSIARPALDEVVIGALREQLMRPEHVVTFVAEFTAEWNRLMAERSAGATGRRSELASVQRKLDGLVDAIADGLRAPDLQTRLDDLGRRKTALERELADAPPSAPSLHPNLADLYRQRVADLASALAGPGDASVLEAARALIDRVTLRPHAEARRGFQVEIEGELSALLRAGGADRDTIDAVCSPLSAKVVAGTGFEPVTFRL